MEGQDTPTGRSTLAKISLLVISPQPPEYYQSLALQSQLVHTVRVSLGGGGGGGGEGYMPYRFDLVA